MKKKQFLILPALVALAFMSLLFTGCSKSSPDEDSIVGTWYCETMGEYDDVIQTQIVFEKGGTGKMTLTSAEADEPFEHPFKWKIDGSELVFMDSDATDDLDYEEIRYDLVLTGSKMVLDPDENCSYELIKK